MDLFLANIVVCGFLNGLIWFVQWVHYPAFRFHSDDKFGEFHLHHTTRTGHVVALPMILELLLGIWLFWTFKEDFFFLQLLTLLCVVLNWAITFFWFIPHHNKIAERGNEREFKKLVQVNWLRTFFWSTRLFLLILLFRMMFQHF
jgi:hypothetical protein